MPTLKKMHLHRGDLPTGLDFGPVVAIDTETMGLNPARDRLCLVQLSRGDGNCHLVQIPPIAADATHSAPNLVRLLADPTILKLFHFARFDVAMLRHALGVEVAPIYCTTPVASLESDAPFDPASLPPGVPWPGREP